MLWRCLSQSILIYKIISEEIRTESTDKIATTTSERFDIDAISATAVPIKAVYILPVE